MYVMEVQAPIKFLGDGFQMIIVWQWKPFSFLGYRIICTKLQEPVCYLNLIEFYILKKTLYILISLDG